VALALLFALGCGGGATRGRRIHQVPYPDEVPIARQQQMLSEAVSNALEIVDFKVLAGKSGYIEVVGLYCADDVLGYIGRALETRLIGQGMFVHPVRNAETAYRVLAVVDVAGADLIDSYKEFFGFTMLRKGSFEGKVRLNVVAYPLVAATGDVVPYELSGKATVVDLTTVYTGGE